MGRGRDALQARAMHGTRRLSTEVGHTFGHLRLVDLAGHAYRNAIINTTIAVTNDNALQLEL